MTYSFEYRFIKALSSSNTPSLMLLECMGWTSTVNSPSTFLRHDSGTDNNFLASSKFTLTSMSPAIQATRPCLSNGSPGEHCVACGLPRRVVYKWLHMCSDSWHLFLVSIGHGFILLPLIRLYTGKKINDLIWSVKKGEVNMGRRYLFSSAEYTSWKVYGGRQNSSDDLKIHRTSFILLPKKGKYILIKQRMIILKIWQSFRVSTDNYILQLKQIIHELLNKCGNKKLLKTMGLFFILHAIW